MPEVFKDNQESFIFIAIGIIFTLIFLYAIYFYNVTIKKWSTVKGIIMVNKAEQDFSFTTKNNWKNKIVFQYTIEGRHYESSGHINVSQKYAFKFLVPLDEKYPPGREVTVYYDPNKPSRSVIDNEFNPLFTIFGAIGTIFLAIAYYLWK